MKRNHRILVVGDTLTANVMQQLVLEDAGYFVVAALGVPSALEAVKHSFFGIAVVDGSLPPEDVRKLLVTLRALSIPSLLVALQDGSQEIKSLADAHIPFQDSFMLTQLVASLLHNPPTTIRKTAVPLGIGEETVEVGEHLAWFFEGDAEFESAVRFLEVGFERGDTGVVYGDTSRHERIGQILTTHGFNSNELVDEGRLVLLDSTSLVGLGDAWKDKAREVIKSLPSLTRVLGCGATDFEWPSDEAFLKCEAQFGAAIQDTRSITVCLYDLNKVSGKRLLYGGFGRHETVVTAKGVVREHVFVDENIA